MTDRPTASALRPPSPIRDDIQSLWMLDGSFEFLNHGSFGARLKTVHEAQDAWRRQLDAQPVQFLYRDGFALIEQAKAAVGAFLGMRPGDFGFTTNATESVNAVLRSLHFDEGDELLTTNHVYNAVRQSMRYLAQRAGATMIEAELPLPIASPDDVVKAIEGALTDRTKLVVVDHITSPTAIRFPIERIIALCKARDIDVLVDGAHAPGMIDLDVEALGAAYYAGNLHKWICAPPGAAFLWVRPDKQESIHPNIISHFLGEGFANEFAWQGTRDITAWLTVPIAIEQVDALTGEGSWPRIRAHNDALAEWVQVMLAEAWGIAPSSPADGSMLGSMAALTLPQRLHEVYDTPEEFQERLRGEHRIEVPVFEWMDRWMIRPCCNVYNRAEQYERLAEAVIELGP